MLESIFGIFFDKKKCSKKIFKFEEMLASIFMESIFGTQPW